MELAQPLLIEGVPNVDKTITTTSSKSVVATMEGDSIDRVYVLGTLLFHTMTFEGILLFLNFCICVQVLDCYSAIGGK